MEIAYQDALRRFQDRLDATGFLYKTIYPLESVQDIPSKKIIQNDELAKFHQKQIQSSLELLKEIFDEVNIKFINNSGNFSICDNLFSLLKILFGDFLFNNEINQFIIDPLPFVNNTNPITRDNISKRLKYLSTNISTRFIFCEK